MPIISVRPPLAGISRRFGFQQQPPFSCFDSLNFWPIDAVTGRLVCATRPPRAVLNSGGEFSGLTVNALQRVNGDATQSPQETMVAAAGGDVFYWNGTGWTKITSGPTLTTGRPVYTAPFLKRVFFMVDTTAPVVFNYDDNSLVTASATAGTFPTDCRVAANWAGALWVAGAASTPHIFSCSKTGDPFDWDFTDTSTAGAFTVTGDNAGLIGEPISALVPHSADILLIAGRESIYAMLRHPRRGGELEALPGVTGMLGQGAWCHDNVGRLYFLSKLGLVTVEPQSFTLSPISQEKIPDELLHVTSAYLSPTICMEYDSRWHGIHITIRGTDQQAWWYDIATGGFHRMAFSDYPLVMASFADVSGEGQSGVLYGGAGYGGVSRFDNTASESMHARLVAGPLKLSQSVYEKSKIQFAQFLFSGNTTSASDTTLNIWGGATPEDVVARYQSDTRGFRFSQALDTNLANGGRCYPLVSGNSALIEINSASDAGGTKRVVFDGVELRTEKAGRIKAIPSLTDASSDPAAIFNPSLWQLYATATATAPGSDLTDFSAYIQLSRMPSAWWDAVHYTGRDIRVSGSSSTLLPYDLIDFDYANQTGLLVVKFSPEVSDSATRVVRVYVGNPDVSAPGASSSIGSNNAYSSDVLAFYPSGAGTDRTSNSIDLGSLDPGASDVSAGAVEISSVGDGDSVLDVSATHYVSTQNFHAAEFSDTTIAGGTILAVLKNDVAYGSQAADAHIAMTGEETPGDSSVDFGLALSTFGFAVSDGLGAMDFYRSNDDSEFYTSDGGQVLFTSTPTTDTFTHGAARAKAPSETPDDKHDAFQDGVDNPAVNLSAEQDNLSNCNCVGIVVQGASSSNGYHIALTEFHKSRLSDDYIAYHASMLTQSSFWGSWATV